MPVYRAPLDDIRFVLHEVLGAARLAELPDLAEATPDLIDAVITEGARFAENVLFPLNPVGDIEGCAFENGVVRMPPGFADAYAQFSAGGWGGIAADPAYGGQGLPHLVHFVMDEVFNSANLAFTITPLLTGGAYDAIERFGNEALKVLYLPRLASGAWTGTMCLTEPQAGSDLGLVRTRAEPGPDGGWRLTGSKLFISAGEHDMAENIVHLVLARLPDGPPGTRGISLFLVPKFLPDAEGEEVRPGRRNAIACTAIEHKMGIHGSPTCVLALDGAEGRLVGEAHRGMTAMFVMMNKARLGVAMQGLGIAEVAYQNAVAYARERLQGRAPGGAGGSGPARAPGRPADPIIGHPDVRRMLLTMKAQIEPARALALRIGYAIDVMSHHPDPAARQDAEDLVALMTPIAKAYFTDLGFDCANLAVQVYGGHGYVRDNGVEQYVRDGRIPQIYEGTNGIQALDLVGRKLSQAGGRLLRGFTGPIEALLREHGGDPALAEFVAPLAEAFALLQRVTAHLGRPEADPVELAAAATDTLRLFALVALAREWVEMVAVAQAQLPAAGARAPFYAAKLASARFFMARLLPQTGALAAAILSGPGPVMALDETAF